MFFIGREKELSTLEKLWERTDFQFIVMYGRRRVGKSTLLAHFAENKHAIYHLAQETSPKITLEQFSHSVSHVTGQGGIRYESWGSAFDDIARLAKTKRLLLIIDEFPYLAESNTGLLSLMQSAIDTVLKDTPLFLILCGSTIGFMEREVLGAKSPLFGRRTGQMRVEPFDYLTSSDFVPEYSNIDKALTYSVFGGVPHYLSKLNGKMSLAQNIREIVLEPYSYLYDEPILLLKQELREPAIYNAVIEAIASGASRLNEIATRIGEDVSKCGKYLQTLIDLGFVLRETPVNEKAGGRKTLYALKDPFFSFWYSFVFPNRSMFETGLADFVMETEAGAWQNQYAGRQFERICAEFLHHLNRDRKLPFVFSQLGRWWGSDVKRRVQVELDLVALDKNKALICECKWTNEPVDMRVLASLLTDGEAFSYEHKQHALFSKSGFTTAVVKESQQRGILLFSLDDMFDKVGMQL